ncbi:acyltransferase [Corallococcus sp. AB038B]|uniref:acyltransferase family protein n=1 Tax=Corallococcus sp. AB038B TaxID=2316718 RepID=UPI000EE61FF1|nr:acyltransferase [Corallococcus sp. AB038B]RKI01425.1 acyltransferase [Corallococcus sp. AB038B]
MLTLPDVATETRVARVRKALSEELFFVRGVSLLLVVLVHVIGVEPFQGVRKLFSPERAELRFVAELIHSFNMAVMIIGSGVAVSLFGAPDSSFREFAHKKLRKLVIPMVVWAPVFLYTHELSQARPRTPGGWLVLLGQFPAAWFPPYAIFWFIHALVGCTCLAWVYQRIVPARYHWNGLSYLGLSWVLYAAVEALDSPLSGIGMRYLRFILFWNCLFGLGMSLSPWLVLARSRLSQWPLALQGLVPLGFLGLLVSFHVSGLAEGHLDPRLITGPLGFCMQFTLAIFLLGASWKGLASRIVYLGSISMPLYLFHIYFVSGMRLALGKVLPGAPLVLHLALGSLVGLMGPLGLYLLLERNRAFRWSIGLPGVPLDTPGLGADESPGTRPRRVEASTMKGADV